METRGLDVACESGENLGVGKIGERVDVVAANEFGEQGSSGGANGAGVTLETRLRNCRAVELQFEPDAIAAKRIELFVTDVGCRQAAVVARVPEVVQEDVTV